MLTLGDVRAAEGLAVLNSLRGRRSAWLLPDPMLAGAGRLRVAGTARTTDDHISARPAGAGERLSPTAASRPWTRP
ncbi:hypothetical protein [Blastococcus brunescens]|uniref:hypothetical protein n=1 Tax=Blastococcus brunescens TaxID=1564165 RepID=UPI003BEEB78F